MRCPASQAPPRNAAAVPIATARAASAPAGQPLGSWARRDKSQRPGSSLRPVLLEQLLQRTGGIICLQRRPHRIGSPALQEIDSLLSRQIGHQESNDLEVLFARQVL